MSEKDKYESIIKELGKVISKLTGLIVFLFIVVLILFISHITGLPNLSISVEKINNTSASNNKEIKKEADDLWHPADTSSIPQDDAGALIRYGRNLIANTSFYLGPQGKVAHSSNGMNCQNCHLDAGTKPFGNNYSGVAANYPKFRERSGTSENIYKRVNDCFERSLNGKAPDSTSKEMQAIVAYIKWVGKDVTKGTKPKGVGLTELTYLDRPADPEKGKEIFKQKCVSCHSENGEGKLNADGLSYLYPPLWGDHSYNNGAGLYRLSRFAGYIKSNMPQGATYDNPQLSDEEAWDVAAFVNSQPRPKKDLSKDWPKIASKPVDHPYGPYADKFTEQQHKYGPFEPIAAAKKNNNKNK